jgi:hypothetical protein
MAHTPFTRPRATAASPVSGSLPGDSATAAAIEGSGGGSGGGG